ncbi:MAG TPA: hypothetical protein ENK44_07160 [Caldithrix abyssi]|uniref:Uncharacterized protein n=1 Tax=Caldithrix abyssi TaxID=187145 RepID=A0A7V4WUL2_CALAY|nr:hypothetical protein [Caldithrix abyssi]
MASDLMDELVINGLHSINFLFSSLRRFEDDAWHSIEGDVGQRLFEQLSATTDYPVEKVNSTTWQNGNEVLEDNYYSVQLECSSVRREYDLKQDLEYFIQLQDDYPMTQLYLNGKFEINDFNRSQVRNWLMQAAKTEAV